MEQSSIINVQLQNKQSSRLKHSIRRILFSQKDAVIVVMMIFNNCVYCRRKATHRFV